jgi:SH3 domain-containing YSC84-like protein 1
MIRQRLGRVGALVVLFGCGGSRPASSAAEARASARDRAVEEMADATQVLDEMTAIPTWERQRAQCIVIVSPLVRAGFIVGGRHGRGVAMCRHGSGWTGPVFLTVTGASAGLQAGIESSDLVMLVVSDRGMSKLLRSSFAVGADASAAAGPIGEAAQAATDASMTAEILSYARSRGLFAGAEIGGAVVGQDLEALVALYGAQASVRAILAGEVKPPAEAIALLAHAEAAFPAPP